MPLLSALPGPLLLSPNLSIHPAFSTLLVLTSSLQGPHMLPASCRSWNSGPTRASGWDPVQEGNTVGILPINVPISDDPHSIHSSWLEAYLEIRDTKDPSRGKGGSAAHPLQPSLIIILSHPSLPGVWASQELPLLHRSPQRQVLTCFVPCSLAAMGDREGILSTLPGLSLILLALPGIHQHTQSCSGAKLGMRLYSGPC